MDWEMKIRQKADEILKKTLKKIRIFSWDNCTFHYREEHIDLIFSIGMGIGKS